MSIKLDLCPKACGECDRVLAGSPIVGAGTTSVAAGCADKRVQINSKNCAQIAADGFCGANTNIGNVGRDLCPKSCGNCPPVPDFSSAVNPSSYTDPTPARTHGAGGSQGQWPVPSPPSPSPSPRPTGPTKRTTTTAAPCTDDIAWRDMDGDGCRVYKTYIDEGTMTRSVACNYGGGQAKQHCMKTCNSCPQQQHKSAHPLANSDQGGEKEEAEEPCEDEQCITEWERETGQCFSCEDYSGRCAEPDVARDCPVTCGLCGKGGLPPADASTTAAPQRTAGKCKDEPCVMHWKKDLGVCIPCEDYAEDYCGTDEQFMASCPKSCQLCEEFSVARSCTDSFKAQSCAEYKDLGWCRHEEISQHCQKTCNLCDTKKESRLAKEEGEERVVHENVSTTTLRAGAESNRFSVAATLVVLAATARTARLRQGL